MQWPSAVPFDKQIVLWYDRVEAAWEKFLGSPLGAVFCWPADITYNSCAVCHWWRGAMVGAAATAAISGCYLSAVLLLGVVVTLVAAQKLKEMQ